MFRNNTQYQTENFSKRKFSVPEQKYNAKLKRIIDEALMCAPLFKDSMELGVEKSFWCYLMLFHFCFTLFALKLNTKKRHLFCFCSFVQNSPRLDAVRHC